MANYYIADLHLGHENIIRIDGRPFESVEQMNETLTENWNRTVGDTDTVYILGDMIWGKESGWHPVLSRLKGQKVLIRGNHDPKEFSPETGRFFRDIADYREIRDAGRQVILCHYAIPFHRAAYDPDCWMLYGHVHSTREQDFLEQLRAQVRGSCTQQGYAEGNFVNVGCMMPWMGYTPRTLDEIIEGTA